MHVALADIRTDGDWISKDTVAGGYGSRLRPFSRVTRVIGSLKRRFHDLPSLQLGYLAGIFAAAGHTVTWTSGPLPDEPVDVAIVLSSLVDHRREARWADAARARGARVGVIGLTASKLPELFLPHADFVVRGEPEAAARRLAAGEHLSSLVDSPEPKDLDALPFPRWDLIAKAGRSIALPYAVRPVGGAFPLLASRGCPEFCTYCPHRILTSYRTRSVDSIVAELTWLATLTTRPYVVFRDPLFTEERARVLELCTQIRRQQLEIDFECETRLDRLDESLLDAMRAAGLRAISFGVESLSPDTLKRAGRRPIPDVHQRRVVDHCRRIGVATAAFYVLGFVQDTWESIAATIEYSVSLRSTVAQFKLLTPYPGTPMWKQLAPLVAETDWERFDGFTPLFNHPNLNAAELRFLLGAAYTHFYIRPSYLSNYLRVRSERVGRVVNWLDDRVRARHARREVVDMAKAVSC
jgi:anaerobic magnesium-protoporphyrin IX monomethyl ester cyclase